MPKGTRVLHFGQMSSKSFDRGVPHFGHFFMSSLSLVLQIGQFFFCLESCEGVLKRPRSRSIMPNYRTFRLATRKTRKGRTNAIAQADVSSSVVWFVEGVAFGCVGMTSTTSTATQEIASATSDAKEDAVRANDSALA